jgi:peptidoglycan/LPS O-acetylase OafA/YrhL
MNLTHFKLGYRSEFDGLRAIAILSVMLGHISLIGRGPDLLNPIKNIISKNGLLNGGVFGVDIFYVLSGFLITSILLEELNKTGAINYKRFYIRRALRLMPALLVLLFFSAMYTLIENSGSFGITAIILALFYISNYARIFVIKMGMLTHTWSLSLEEQFYILWPFTLKKIIQDWPNKIYLIIISLMISSAIIRFILYKLGAPYFAWGALFSRADGVLAGGLVSIMAYRGELLKIKQLKILSYTALISISILLLMVDGNSRYLFYGIYFIASISTAIFLAGLISFPLSHIKKFLQIRFLRHTGKISYGLYLYHMPIFCLFPIEKFSNNLSGIFISILIVFSLTYLLASISYWLIEIKFIRYSHKIA